MENAPRPAPVKRTSGVVVPHKLKWHQKLVSGLVYALAQTLMATWRMRWDDRSGLFDEAKKSGAPVIFCVWHNRLALSMTIYRRFVLPRRPGQGLAALISASKDGALLADVLQKFGVQSVRGSSSRRGAQALLEATGWLERGSHVAITPDGPRGPCYQVQPGVIALAQVSGCVIVPVSATIRGKLQTKSWDRFQIPLPFARCHVILDQPIVVPKELSDDERRRLQERVEQALRTITED